MFGEVVASRLLSESLQLYESPEFLSAGRVGNDKNSVLHWSQLRRIKLSVRCLPVRTRGPIISSEVSRLPGLDGSGFNSNLTDSFSTG